jgi:antitoxin component YwqK of YwqJK toxin-antitoxin module
MHGEGRITYADGATFQGSFVEGRKHGDAVEVDASGTRLECVYVEGERHGDFKEYDANGKLIATGVYNMGKRSNK